VIYNMSQAVAGASSSEHSAETFPFPGIDTSIHERPLDVKRESFDLMPTQCSNVLGNDNSMPVRKPSFAHRSFQKVSKGIYILGAGELGKFVAYALTSMADAPLVVLLSYRGDLVQQWVEGKQILNLPTSNRGHSSLDFKDGPKSAYHTDECSPIIDKLIITTNAKATISSLTAVKDRLLPRSTICFLQNGMGIIEQVNAKIFPNPAFRPRYMVGLPPHVVPDGCGRPVTTVDHTYGTTYVSLVPNVPMTQSIQDTKEEYAIIKPLVQRMFYGWTASSRSLMRSLTRSPLMKIKGYQYEKLLLVQLERLAVSAALEPMSVVFDCVNGQLFNNLAMKNLMRALLGEIVTVIQSLPELQKVGNLRDQYTVRHLESLTMQLAARTSDSISPMLQDVRRGRRTEINFVNGYFLKRGLELGISCPLNNTFIQMVQAKQAMVRLEKEKLIPFRGA
jgi:2-dehydropantoate 2-reductase